jgi:hypothetical protein
MCAAFTVSLHTSACVVVRFYEMYEKEMARLGDAPREDDDGRPIQPFKK